VSSKTISKYLKGMDWNRIIFLALSWSFLLLSHNLMVLIFGPVFLFFVLLRLWQKNAWAKVPHLIFAGILSLGIASFFTLPALLENKFTQVKSVLEGYYDYSAHFVSIRQLLFSRFWGYGPSVWGVESDGMPFQIGHIHWVLSIIIAILIIFYLLRNFKNIQNILRSENYLLITIFMIMVGWGSLFMAHQKSAVIWTKISALEYLQFPWRFLTLATFAFSFIVGFIPGAITIWKKNKNRFIRIIVTLGEVLITFLLIVLLVVINWNYFRPDGGRLGKVTDEAKFSGVAWELQQTAGIYDYLPITSKIAPNGPKRVVAEIMEGEVDLQKPEEGTYWVSFIAKVTSEKSKVRMNILDFPNWKVFANGVEISKYIPEEEMFGRFWIDLPKGEYSIYAKFYNTPIRTFSNIVSLISIIGVILILFRKSIFNGKI
jgi:hypothetical protein